MQVGMNPRSGRVVDVLRYFVRSRPISLGVMPEGEQWTGDGWRGRGVERGQEFVECHRANLWIPLSNLAWLAD
jgi:hypothetical protein